MINNEELRIGNYIAHKDRAFKIVSIQERYVGLNVAGSYAADVRLEDVNPIPVNPTLFANVPHHINSKDSFEVITETRTFIFSRYNDLCWNVSQKIDDVSSFPLTTLCFLHQFQNLVFLLTNKELEILL